MLNIQALKTFLKKPGFILFIIVFAFVSRESLLVTISPLFTGQDETRHYNTIQYLTGPAEKDWNAIEFKKDTRDAEDIETYNFSEEIQETHKSAGINNLRIGLFNKQTFTDSYDGQSEDRINDRPWEPINKTYPPDVLEKRSRFYHQIGAVIENALSEQPILSRFYAIRLFSVFLGTIMLIVSYLIFKTIGFQEKESLIITTILSLQSKFSTYYAIINYDALLILLFTTFTLGGILSLKNGPNWKNITLMLISVIFAILAKGTGIVLLGAFILIAGYHLKNKFHSKNNSIIKLSLSSIAIIGLVWFVLIKQYPLKNILPFSDGASLHTVLTSLYDYLSASLPRIDSASAMYWGSLSWGALHYSDFFVKIIWIIEALSLIGLILFFKSSKKPDYLPEKKYIVLLIGMILVLQLSIRLFDWRVFISTGSLDLGTPGRYFLPNIAAHLAIMFTGIGMLFKERKNFNTILSAMLIIFFAFLTNLTLNVIVPRFYF